MGWGLQQTLWNKSNHKLQTNGDHHWTQLDEIWLMVLSTALLKRFSNNVRNIQKTSWNWSNHKLQTKEDDRSTQLDEIRLMVLSTASLMHFSNKVYNVEKTSWNRSNHKLQTKEDHHPTQLDEIWLMVLSTASFMHFRSNAYKIKKTHETGQIVSYRQNKTTIRHNSTRSETWCYPQRHLCTSQTKFISSLDNVYIKFKRSLYQV